MLDEQLRQHYLKYMGIEPWIVKPSPYRIFLVTDTQGDLALVAVVTNQSPDQQQQLWQNIVSVFRDAPGKMVETTYVDIPVNCHTASRIIVLGDFISKTMLTSHVLITNSLEDMIQNPSLKANVWHAITSTFSPRT